MTDKQFINNTLQIKINGIIPLSLTQVDQGYCAIFNDFPETRGYGTNEQQAIANARKSLINFMVGLYTQDALNSYLCKINYKAEIIDSNHIIIINPPIYYKVNLTNLEEEIAELNLTEVENQELIESWQDYKKGDYTEVDTTSSNGVKKYLDNLKKYARA